MLANMCQALGAENILEGVDKQAASVQLLFKSLATLLSDGSLDVRQEAKRAFSVLVEHENFDQVLHNSVGPNLKLRKQLEGLKSGS